MTSQTPKQFIRLQAKKPLGGYIIPLTVQQLCLLWWLYRARHIRLLDLRVWYAAQEMVARRCQMEPGQVPAYTHQELRGLVGSRGGDRLRASTRRLEHLGLLTWSPHTLTFATSPNDLQHLDDVVGFNQMFAKVPHHHRRVPMPRQTIRLIAGGLRPAVIATILGTCIRCLYHHPRQAKPVHSGGWVKCSWIADVFQIHLRNVKAARRHLTNLGWMLTFTTPQRVQNRWGLYTQVCLTWERAALRAATVGAVPARADISPSALPPPPAFSTPQLPPPLRYSKPLQESKHQKPAPQADNTTLALMPHQHPQPAYGGPPSSGVQGKEGRTQAKTAAPTITHIIPEDLHDTARLLALFTQAHTKGLIGTSDADRLTFVATAEHAYAIDTANPPGLFAHLIRHRLWHHVTQEDEDLARRRLRDHLYGAHPSCRLPGPLLPLLPPLSPDASLVARLGERLLSRRCQGDLFAAARADLPGWTRERWDRAFDELERAATSTPPLPMPPPEPPLLSKDARTVQLLRHDLTRADFRGDIFPVLHHEYPDWTRERWQQACAELETAHTMHPTAGARRRVGEATAQALEVVYDHRAGNESSLLQVDLQA